MLDNPEKAVYNNIVEIIEEKPLLKGLGFLHPFLLACLYDTS